MSVAVYFHDSIQVIQISVDGDSVFLRRDQASDFLAKFMGSLVDSIPDGLPADETDHPGFSRKVPDAPALRLVGGFACDPDPSCGMGEAS